MNARFLREHGDGAVRRLTLFITCVALTVPARGSANVVGQPMCPSTTASAAQFVSSVHWVPAIPTAGALFRVVITSAEARAALFAATFIVSGEPLHMRTAGDSLVALAAVPIDSINGITLAVQCADSTIASIRIRSQPGAYRLERLRVAPRFAAAPDSALSDRLRREAAQAATVSRNAHETPRLWTAPFVPPRATRITSGFGGGRVFNSVVTSRHMGTDFAGAVGDPVRAANRGVVRLVEQFYLGGHVVYIDHGEGVVTAYLHLSRQLVVAGDTVARGAVIGRVGATGRVTGPHLHFIARYGAVTVDPASLFAVK